MSDADRRDDNGRMTDAEAEELTQRRDREELDRLRREQAGLEFSRSIREQALAMREDRIAAGQPTRGDVRRAYEVDLREGPKPGQPTGVRAGSTTAVAFRLGIPKRTFFRWKERLGMGWPPPLDG